jgi:putative ABC transport system permease protein
VRETATFDARIIFVFLGTFSLFAIIATILVVASSIGSIVLSQFRQIGILKAIGFTQGQVLWLYLGQYLALTLIGSPLGLLLGFALAPLPLRSVAVSLSTPYRPPLNPWLVLFVFGTVAAVVALASLGAAFRGARANIIQSIAIGAEAPRKKSPWGVRLANRLGLPVVLSLGLDDVLIKPGRSLLTGINLTLGVTGIVLGLALSETLDTYRADPSLLGVVYDATLTREVTSDSKARHILETAPGVDAFYSEHQATVETPAGQSFQVRAVEGDLAAFPFTIEEGRFFEPNTYEAIAGRGLLDWLGLEVGDDITIIFEGQSKRQITLRIVGQYLESFNQGQMLMISLPTVARHVKQAKPDIYLLKLTPGCNTAKLKQHLEPRPDSDLNLTLVKELPDYIVYLQLAVFALSAILVGIAVINVFNASLLAVREKLRLIGVLKAVGMTPVQVIGMIGTTAGFLGLLAAVVGLFVGLSFTRGLTNTLSRSYGFGEVQVTLDLLKILLLPPLVVGISMLGSFMPGWQAARLSIVTVLRNE